MSGFTVAIDGSDVTERLAGILGLEIEVFLDVFGAGWRYVAYDGHDFDADPSGGLGLPRTPWAMAGEPAQLMAHVFPHGAYLARAEGVWAAGTHDLEHHPSRPRYVRRDQLDQARETVRELLHRRRRTFFHCILCRRLTPPEERDEARTCMACASRWRGVVH